MQFLNPSVLFGMLAAAIPILIHLLNLRRLKKVDFSSNYFLREIQKTKIRKVKIKQWLLLIIRFLIILLIVLAFSRPTLKNNVISGISSKAKQDAVIIIDNSFSMMHSANDGTLLNNAKLLALNITEQFSSSDGLALLNFHSDTSIVQLNFNKDEIKKEISDIKLSYAKCDLTQLIYKGIDILKNSNNLVKELYIISDFQKYSINLDSLSQLSVPENYFIYLSDFDFKQPQNTSISDIEIRNKIIQLNSKIDVQVKITNHSENSLNNNSVSLFINGERKSSINFSADANSVNSLFLETVLSNPGFNSIEVSSEEDGIIADNSAFISFFIPEQIKIKLVDDSPEQFSFIEAVLNSAPGENYIKTERFRSSNISSINESNTDLIIIENIENNFSYFEQLFLKGIPFIIFTDKNIANREFLGIKFGENITSDSRKADYLQFKETDTEHPLFEGLFKTEKNREFESPQILSFNIISTEFNYKPVISLSNNIPFLLDIERNGNKLLIFNTSADITSGSFVIKSIFPPLIIKSVLYLTSASSSEKGVIVGEEIILRDSLITKIVTPSNETIYTSGIISKKIETDLPGIYKLFKNNTLAQYIPANLNSFESKTEYFSAKQVSKSINSQNINYFKTHENVFNTINSARFGEELWKLFIILALLLAITEMIISQNNKKDMGDITPNK